MNKQFVLITTFPKYCTPTRQVVVYTVFVLLFIKLISEEHCVLSNSYCIMKKFVLFEKLTLTLFDV